MSVTCHVFSASVPLALHFLFVDLNSRMLGLFFHEYLNVLSSSFMGTSISHVGDCWPLAVSGPMPDSLGTVDAEISWQVGFALCVASFV